jgi:hypothetical protein
LDQVSKKFAWSVTEMFVSSLKSKTISDMFAYLCFVLIRKM